MESYFSIDTMLQGLIMVFCIVIGCLIFFTYHLEKKEKDNNSLSNLNSQLGNVFICALQLIAGIKSMEGSTDRIEKASKCFSYIIMFAACTGISKEEIEALARGE